MAAYGLVTFLSFPQPWMERSLDLGIALAPLGPCLLLLGLRGLSARAAWRWGFGAGLLGYGAVLHWIYVVTVVHGRASPLVGVLAVMALATYVAAFTAIFAGGAAWLSNRGSDSPWLVAALWSALDYLRTFAFTGFPWALLGYAWHANRPLMALVSFTGVYGLSFAAALAGAALADLRLGRRARALRCASVLALLHGLGAWLAAAEAPRAVETARVAVLQGNIPQGRKWSPDWVERTLAVYEDLTRRAAARGAQLVVWPETAVPGSPDADLELRRRMLDLAREARVTLIAGAVGLEGFDPGTRAVVGELRYYDSALLIDFEGRRLGRYDKTHLVPFGEYVPLRALLGHFVKALATGVASGDVSAGARPRSLRVPIPPAEASGGGTLTAGVPICYELLFPDLVRRFVDDGAQALFAITNDAWYGRTGAPYQFLVITALRSAENRVWTARAANTGVSAFIDERGQVRRQTRIFERGLLVEDVPLRPSREAQTFYARHGDVFAQACWVVVAVSALRGARASRPRPRRSAPPADPAASGGSSEFGGVR